MLHGHGGDVYTIAKELGVHPLEVLDFSSNCSPLPYPDGFHNHLCKNLDQMHLLPEVDSVSIRQKLGKRYGLHPDRFLIGGGTTQWIYALPRLSGSVRAFVSYPTYSDYEDACKAAGVEVRSIGTYPSGSPEDETRFLADLQALDDRLLEKSIIFVCNPNNPTGLFLEPERLLKIIRQKTDSALWVIDESYAPFIDEDRRSSLLGHDLPENVVLLRSFSKIYGIPGLRVGCLVGDGWIMNGLISQMRPWAVNRMAQLALEFLLERPEFETKVRETCKREKDFLVASISKIKGFYYVEGRCHYALFALKGKIKAKAIAEALKQKGILIRDCHNFKGLDGQYIRISPRLRADNEKLIEEISHFCSSH